MSNLQYPGVDAQLVDENGNVITTSTGVPVNPSSTLASATEVVPTQITKTVAAAATPEVLAADGTFFRHAVVLGKKAARTNNTGIVYLGIGATNDTQPYAINPGEAITIEAPMGAKFDLNDFVLDVVTAADGVIIIYS